MLTRTPLVALCFQAHRKNVSVYIGSKVHSIRPMLPSRDFLYAKMYSKHF
jgi:hypothetical protein